MPLGPLIGGGVGFVIGECTHNKITNDLAGKHFSRQISPHCARFRHVLKILCHQHKKIEFPVYKFSVHDTNGVVYFQNTSPHLLQLVFRVEKRCIPKGRARPQCCRLMWWLILLEEKSADWGGRSWVTTVRFSSRQFMWLKIFICFTFVHMKVQFHPTQNPFTPIQFPTIQTLWPPTEQLHFHNHSVPPPKHCTPFFGWKMQKNSMPNFIYILTLLNFSATTLFASSTTLWSPGKWWSKYEKNCTRREKLKIWCNLHFQLKYLHYGKFMTCSMSTNTTVNNTEGFPTGWFMCIV